MTAVNGIGDRIDILPGSFKKAKEKDMREVLRIILDVALYLERVVVDLVREICFQSMLRSADLKVHSMLSRLLRRQLVGLHELIGEGLLIGLARLLVIDRERNGICIRRIAVLERHFK